MGKLEAQTGRVPTRLFARRSAGPASDAGVALEENDLSSEGAFYRPATRRQNAGRSGPNLGSVPARDRSSASFEEDEDVPFLRSKRRVAVRRGLLPRGRWGRIGLAVGAMALLGGLAWLGYAVRSFAAHDPRFRIESSDNIQIIGNSQVTGAELLSVFGGDMGRNVFFVPLRQRRAELERLPWVGTATVMRLLPDQLRISIVERTPVAFARTGNTIGLVDRDGVLLDMDPKTLAAKHYSFPVVTGIVAGDPASTRAARMGLYRRFIAELDAGGGNLSSQISEIDVADPEDVKAVVASGGSDLLLHFGDQDFLARWQNYQQHLAEWKAQYPHLASVDLRYERQVVLQMRKDAPLDNGSLSAAAAAGSADTNPAQAAKSASGAAAAKKHGTRPKPRSVARPYHPAAGTN